MTYLKEKHLRSLAKTDLKITAVYPAYRSWGLLVWDKFIWKTFKVDKESWKFMEQKWDENKKPYLVSMTEKMDKTFFQTYKKTFDVAFETANIITIDDGKKEFTDNQFTIPVKASKLKDIMRVFIEDIPMDWDREAFDWEDNFTQNLVWNFIRFTVTWQWLDTKYTYKEWKAFTSSELADVADLPF